MPRIVPTVHTGGTRRAWVDRVFADLVYALDRRGIELDTAYGMAAAISAHLWRETGEGDNEYDFAPGNIACAGAPDPPNERGWHGDCWAIASGRYRAYADSADGIEDYVQLLEGARYRDSWLYLLEHPDDGPGWYGRLLHDGYSAYSESAVNEYTRILASWRRVRAS